MSPRARALVSKVKASRYHAGFPHCTNVEQGSFHHSNIRGPPWALAAVRPCPLAPTHTLKGGRAESVPSTRQAFPATLLPRMCLLALPQYPINHSLLYSYPNI